MITIVRASQVRVIDGGIRSKKHLREALDLLAFTSDIPWRELDKLAIQVSGRQITYWWELTNEEIKKTMEFITANGREMGERFRKELWEKK